MIGNDDGEGAKVVLRILVERTVERIERFKNVIREKQLSSLTKLLERARSDSNGSFTGLYAASTNYTKKGKGNIR